MKPSENHQIQYFTTGNHIKFTLITPIVYTLLAVAIHVRCIDDSVWHALLLTEMVRQQVGEHCATVRYRTDHHESMRLGFDYHH